MHIVEFLGRLFISSLFIIEGFRKFSSPDGGMMYMSQYGVPEILFYPSVVFEIIVPLLLVIGYKTRIMSSLLFLFVLTVTVIFHTDFGNSMQLISFLKNTSIMGGLLIIISNKPQKFSIDYYQGSKKGN